MFLLFRGDCEHCGRDYRYSIVDAAFSDCSYAYCDKCGKLATVSYSNSLLVKMPPISTPHQVIDSAWEPYLRHCSCKGHFRHNASPRCTVCLAELSAAYAGAHITRNFGSASRGWRWQGDWSGSYCIDIEDPLHPGVVRQLADPFLESKFRARLWQTEKPGLLSRLFKAGS